MDIFGGNVDHLYLVACLAGTVGERLDHSGGATVGAGAAIENQNLQGAHLCPLDNKIEAAVELMQDIERCVHVTHVDLIAVAL